MSDIEARKKTGGKVDSQFIKATHHFGITAGNQLTAFVCVFLRSIRSVPCHRRQFIPLYYCRRQLQYGMVAFASDK